MRFRRQPRDWSDVRAVAEIAAARIGNVYGLSPQKRLTFWEFNESIERLFARHSQLNARELAIADEAQEKLGKAPRVDLGDGLTFAQTSALSEKPHHAVFDANEAFFQGFAVVLSNLASMVSRFKEPFHFMHGDTVDALLVATVEHFPHLAEDVEELALAFRHKAFLCDDSARWPRTWNTIGSATHRCEVVFYGFARAGGAIPADSVQLDAHPEGYGWEKWAPNVDQSKDALSRVALHFLDALANFHADPKKYRKKLLD